MNDTSAELLVELLRSDADSGSINSLLRDCAIERPELAPAANTALQSVLEAEATQWLDPDAELPDRTPVPCRGVESLTPRESPTFTGRIIVAENTAWALFGLAINHGETLSQEGAIEPLSQLTQVKDTGLRCHALATLAAIGARGSESAVRVAIKDVREGLDSEWLVERALAAWGATELCLHVPVYDQFRGRLRALLGDRSRYVRLNAAEAVFVHHYQHDGRPRFSRSEAFSLVEGASSLSVAPLRILAEAGLAAAAEVVEDATHCYCTDSVESLWAGHGLVGAIHAGLRDLTESPSAADRAAAAAALGFLGPGFGWGSAVRDRGVPLLNGLYDDENDTVRAIAEWLYHEGPNAWHSMYSDEVDGPDAGHAFQGRVLDAQGVDIDDRPAVFDHADYAVIDGPERTVCATDEFAVEDSHVLLDRRQRQNAGVTTGETVTVEPASPVNAARATFRLPDGIADAAFVDCVCTTGDVINRNVVTAGDVFSVDIRPAALDIEPPTCGDDEQAVYRVPLEVVETIPSGPVYLGVEADLFFDTATPATDGNGNRLEAEMVVKQTDGFRCRPGLIAMETTEQEDH